jgi:hypothetical protein
MTDVVGITWDNVRTISIYLKSLATLSSSTSPARRGLRTNRSGTISFFEISSKIEKGQGNMNKEEDQQREEDVDESYSSEQYYIDLSALFSDTVYQIDKLVSLLLQEMFSTKRDVFYWDNSRDNFW